MRLSNKRMPSPHALVMIFTKGRSPIYYTCNACPTFVISQNSSSVSGDRITQIYNNGNIPSYFLYINQTLSHDLSDEP